MSPYTEVREYDPAIPGKDARPEPADLVVCTDVLEHVEPECIQSVVDDIHDLTLKCVYLAIHTGPAIKTLQDGRNAHLIQEGPVIWLIRLGSSWDIMNLNYVPNTLLMFAGKAGEPS